MSGPAAVQLDVRGASNIADLQVAAVREVVDNSATSMLEARAVSAWFREH
jgi:hypothetical protein